ncbi:MAG: hypothetical protein V1676_06415 [Candidatus Diapherotrites archaeon]
MKRKYEKPAIESKEVFERISAALCTVADKNASKLTCMKASSGAGCQVLVS